jgi:hypothetical protein
VRGAVLESGREVVAAAFSMGSGNIVPWRYHGMVEPPPGIIFLGAVFLWPALGGVFDTRRNSDQDLKIVLGGVSNENRGIPDLSGIY